MTSAELAAIADVHPRTVAREVTRGNLAGETAGGYVIETAEARRWLAEFAKYAALRKTE
jgi:hypothetical protein